jgi:hypothetical protein
MVDQCDDARQEIQQIAKAIVDGNADPLVAAMSIYGAAWDSGAWEEDSLCDELAEPGSEFLQLADGLEDSQDEPDAKAAWQALIREVAAAYLAEEPWPDWTHAVASPYPVRRQAKQ